MRQGAGKGRGKGAVLARRLVVCLGTQSTAEAVRQCTRARTRAHTRTHIPSIAPIGEEGGEEKGDCSRGCSHALTGVGGRDEPHLEGGCDEPCLAVRTPSSCRALHSLAAPRLRTAGPVWDSGRPIQNLTDSKTPTEMLAALPVSQNSLWRLTRPRSKLLSEHFCSARKRSFSRKCSASSLTRPIGTAQRPWVRRPGSARARADRKSSENARRRGPRTRAARARPGAEHFSAHSECRFRGKFAHFSIEMHFSAHSARSARAQRA